jgi:hypothetical protein
MPWLTAQSRRFALAQPRGRGRVGCQSSRVNRKLLHYHSRQDSDINPKPSSGYAPGLWPAAAAKYPQANCGRAFDEGFGSQ